MLDDKYEISYFRSNCESILDTRVHVFDGAITYKGWKSNKKVTVKEMKRAIDNFLNHRVG